MTREAALMRSLYLRTLHRYVGPSLGWRVANADNDLRPVFLHGARKGDGHSPPCPSPTLVSLDPHMSDNKGSA